MLLLLLTRSCGIPTLDHEIFNDPVEFGVVIVSSAGQLSKVPTGVGGVFPVKLQHHLTHPVNRQAVIKSEFFDSMMKNI